MVFLNADGADLAFFTDKIGRIGESLERKIDLQSIYFHNNFLDQWRMRKLSPKLGMIDWGIGGISIEGAR